MATKIDSNVRTGAAGYLDAEEPIVATLIASVRGHQQALAGGIAGAVGGSRQARARRSADELGIVLASPMALVLTPKRILTFKSGGRGVPRELLNSFPLLAVESMTVKRLGLGASVTISIWGAPVKLESRVGAARAFAAELARAKVAAES